MYVGKYLQSIARTDLIIIYNTPICMKNCKLPYLLFPFRKRKGKPGHLVEILLKGCIISVWADKNNLKLVSIWSLLEAIVPRGKLRSKTPTKESDNLTICTLQLGQLDLYIDKHLIAVCHHTIPAGRAPVSREIEGYHLPLALQSTHSHIPIATRNSLS